MDDNLRSLVNRIIFIVVILRAQAGLSFLFEPRTSLPVKTHSLTKYKSYVQFNRNNRGRNEQGDLKYACTRGYKHLVVHRLAFCICRSSAICNAADGCEGGGERVELSLEFSNGNAISALSIIRASGTN